MNTFFRILFDRYSKPFTLLLTMLALLGFYLGSGLTLKLSLTDLLPDNHPSVVKFNKITEIVGGVGYLSIVLAAEDGKSHLEIAPILAERMKPSSLIRSAFFQREEYFFSSRMLYYLDLGALGDLETSVRNQITKVKRKAFDLGLWDEDEKKEEGAALGDELQKSAKRAAEVTPLLLSKDKKHLLLMIQPTFDSMEFEKTRQLLAFVKEQLAHTLPPTVTYEMVGRYYQKIEDTRVITQDILWLGGTSILIIALILTLSLRSWRALCVIFSPVLMGLGITAGLAALVIGQINIITGFLMGIISGLGVDYGIHLVLRLRLERKEPSGNNPDPIWRTLESSGHAVFVGALAASFSFYLLCFSTFRAFSEFGFICGTGIMAVLVCLLVTFKTLVRFFKLDTAELPAERKWRLKLPVLETPKAYWAGLTVTLLLGIGAIRVNFEYDFNKMLQHSKKVQELAQLVDDIYERSVVPSVLGAPSKTMAVDLENALKKKYLPSVVKSIVSGATIIPEDQAAKRAILQKIHALISPLRDKWLEQSLEVPATTIRKWVRAEPFMFRDLPIHLQDFLRGKSQTAYLLYIYPSILLDTAQGVHTYASMVKDIESQFPEVLTGSDAVVFAEILDLIHRDGMLILVMIFLSVGFFIWISVRRWDDTLQSYVPLLLALPVGIGLMALCGIKFNMFNIAIIPTFVAMGIDVPIHIVHRAKETSSGLKAARDLASSIHLALSTAGVGFGILIFARAGVLKSLGWISLLATAAIWWVGLFVLPAFLERVYKKRTLINPITVKEGSLGIRTKR